MPEFYTILPEKILFARIWGQLPSCPPRLIRLYLKLSPRDNVNNKINVLLKLPVDE